VTGIERVARAASALAVAGGCVTVTWEADGQWHTAYTDDVADVPAATMATVAVARDGMVISDETTETRMGEDEMNDTEMTQEQKDEAQLQHMRKQIANFGAFAPEAMHAAIRTIDALRAARESAITMIDAEYATLWREFAYDACRALDRIRNALAAPADGSADADADAADGSGVGR
jgi:hypothetical protein